jgi:hypothetical protein
MPAAKLLTICHRSPCKHPSSPLILSIAAIDDSNEMTFELNGKVQANYCVGLCEDLKGGE